MVLCLGREPNYPSRGSLKSHQTNIKTDMEDLEAENFQLIREVKILLRKIAALEVAQPPSSKKEETDLKQEVQEDFTMGLREEIKAKDSLISKQLEEITALQKTIRSLSEQIPKPPQQSWWWT